MARLQASTATFRLAARGSIAEAQARLVAAAKARHEDVMNSDPRPSIFIRYVDGVPNAPEEAVKYNGVIVYDYPRVDVVAQYAVEVLRSVSPVKSGNYRDHHKIFLNGIGVPDLSGWQLGDEVAVSNFVPYARKIELGSMKMRVPGTDHVYEQSRLIIRRKYGDLVKIAFAWRGIDTGDESIVTGKAGNAFAIRYPALIFSEK